MEMNGRIMVLGIQFQNAKMEPQFHACLGLVIGDTAHFFDPNPAPQQQYEMYYAIIKYFDVNYAFIKSDLHRKKMVISVSLDIQGAFDNAWWPFLKTQLINMNCPNNIYSTLCSYLEDRQVEIRYAGANYIMKQSKGCIQGSACGPLLWNILINSILILELPAGATIQAFADDLTVKLVASDGVLLDQLTNQVLQIIENWAVKVKLRFSTQKTFALLHTRRQNYHEPVIYFCGERIAFLTDFKLLGVIIDRNLSFAKHISYVCQKAIIIGKQLYRVANRTWGLSSENLKVLYCGAIEPLITYAAIVWYDAVSKITNVKKLGTLQRTFLLKICRSYRTASNTSLQALAHIMPLDLKIRETAEISKVTVTGVFNGLPDDCFYQKPVKPAELPHPAERTKLKCSTVQLASYVSISNTIDIYTDGSKNEKTCGSAFTAIFNSEEIACRQFKMPGYCSVYQTELFALHEVLKWLMATSLSIKRIRIFTDSLSSLQSLGNPSSTDMFVSSIHCMERQLKLLNYNIEFHWIKAHIGHAGNERADCLAKRAAKSSSRYCFDMYPLSYAKRQIKLKYMNIWNHRYRNSDTGSITRSYFPTINSAKNLLKDGLVGFITTQFFTGHGSFNSYLFRFQLRLDDMCLCGYQQTVQHLLHSCGIFERIRNSFRSECQSFNILENNYTEICGHPHLSSSFCGFLSEIMSKLKED